MSRRTLYIDRQHYIEEHIPYEMCYYTDFDYSILNMAMKINKGNGQYQSSTQDIIIMGDTETSKTVPNAVYYDKKKRKHYKPVPNIVVAWTISIRMFHCNIVTLYGHKPSEMMEAFNQIRRNTDADKVSIYIHNWAYDKMFLQKYLYFHFGKPVQELNIKAHKPLFTEFANGLIFRDSYILAGRSLEKWAKDMQVEHQKAVGKWNYDKIRSQYDKFSKSELTYIEHDTLAGVECLDATCELLNKNIATIPLTATGIPREEIRKRGAKNRARDLFLKSVTTYEQFLKLTKVYHGGYTHGNRKYYDELITNCITQCYDFASSYPFCMLAFKYPYGKFGATGDMTPEDILDKSDGYAFMFKLTLLNVQLKDYDEPMPALQYSKCVKLHGEYVDNGRILGANYVEIYLNEIDLEVIANQYKWDYALCTEVEFATKKYLPRYFTDYIYELFKDKTTLKGSEDVVLYAHKKATLNSCYGMCVQKSIKDLIIEDYDTGEFKVDRSLDPQEEYQKYIDKRANILPYQWGVWVTSYAFRNLFKLGACAGKGVNSSWVYSDTDSCYATNWDYVAVERYNDWCKELLQANGYGAVIHNGREYWLGVAESEGDKDKYTEFKVVGAKRYCGRNLGDGKIHITIAGVPKKEGAECLENNIKKFTRDFVFEGERTGKKTHFFVTHEMGYTSDGQEIADSIDLVPCDYSLDAVEYISDWYELLSESEDFVLC